MWEGALNVHRSSLSGQRRGSERAMAPSLTLPLSSLTPSRSTTSATASLQYFAPRFLPSPTPPGRRQRGGISGTGGVRRRRRGSGRGCHRHGHDSGRAIDELVASHPSKLSGWRSNGAISTAGATVGRSDVRCRRRRLTSALLHLAVVAICATIELFEPPALGRFITCLLYATRA